MFEDNNLWFFLFAVIPAIIYSLIIYHKAPDGVVKIKKMWSYIIIGFLSIQILTNFHFLFPNIHTYIESERVFYRIGNDFVSKNKPTLWAIFVFAFFQVAFIEELSKLFAFKIGNFLINNNIKDSAFAIMFYSTMISVGFAVLENIHYVNRVLSGDLYGINPNKMLIARSVSSVLIHMLSGLFMGYFIAIGKMSNNIFKKLGYTILGLIIATLLHGVYDFNLMKTANISDFINILGINFHILNSLIILESIFISWLMSKKLLKNKKLLR